MSTVISTEGLSKRYRLGELNRRYLFRDINSFFARCLGQPDPNAEVDARVTHTREGIIWALKDVDMEVKDGDVVGIIGRNGSGKSTLLKILSRITSPTEGTARIKGRVASLLEVGTGFHQELTGRDNVYLNGSILGMPKEMIRAKFDEIVAFSGVEEYIDTPVKRYSSGMSVRLAFAVAAHLEPDILIVDEVLAVGDAEFQKKCLGKMGEAVKGGRTILFVSHNAGAVESLCTKGIVLDNGKVAFTGTQTDAIQFYSASTERQNEPLSKRNDRKGSGEVYAVGIRLKDKTGREVHSHVPGESLIVEMDYENPHDLKFPNILLGIVIKSHFDVPIFTISNYVTGDSVGRNLRTSGKFLCEIKDLALMPGLYHLDYYIKTQPKGAKSLDEVNGAVHFTVMETNYYRSGRMPGNGIMLAPTKWEIA